MKSRLQHIALYHTVTIARLLLAATFTFSGFVKAVDPHGMVYKLNAYCAHWGIYFDDTSLVLRFVVIMLATVEFVMGIHIFLGIRRRLTGVLTMLIMVAMTMLTAYIYLYDPVPDCGCFGDAIKLSHSETLAKNVVLLVCSILVLRYGRYMRRLITHRNQWLTSIYAWVYAIGLAFYSFHYLPPLDFTAYQRGIDLRGGWLGETEAPVSDEILTLGFYSLDGQRDYTEEILSDTGRNFLLTIPDIRLADDGCNDRINDLHDVCIDQGWRLYGVVGDHTDSTQLNDWIDRTGAAYPFIMADAVQLKAMVRSTPGLLLLHNGVITHKWSNNDLPNVEAPISSWLAPQSSADLLSPAMRLFLWFFIPLFTIVLIDGIWIGSKYYKHYIFKKTLKQNNHEKENCSR